MEKTIRRGGEKVAGSTSPLTKGKEEERESERERDVRYIFFFWINFDNCCDATDAVDFGSLFNARKLKVFRLYFNCCLV